MIKMSPKVWFLIQTTVHTAHSLTFGLHPLIHPHQHADTWLVRHSESAEPTRSSLTLYLLQVSHGQGSPVSALCIFPNLAPARELQLGTAQKITAEARNTWAVRRGGCEVLVQHTAKRTAASDGREPQSINPRPLGVGTHTGCIPSWHTEFIVWVLSLNVRASQYESTPQLVLTIRRSSCSRFMAV